MLRKFILLIIIILAGVLPFRAWAQVAVISSYFNVTSEPRDEWTEILITGENVDLNNYTLRDNNSNQTGWTSTFITFSNPLWSHLRSGTVIVVWHRQFGSSGAMNPLDVSKDDGYIEVHANDNIYFGGSGFGNPPSFAGNTLNIGQPGDILQLRDPAGNHVHALAHKSGLPGGDWNSMPSPKLNYPQACANFEEVCVCPGSNINEYGWNAPQSGNTYTGKSSTLVSKGLPNQCTASSTANSLYWRSLRQPAWTSPALTAAYLSPTVNLSWNACTDPYPADGSIGYMILRNTVNSFSAPNDGYTYAIGETIGTATVIANISPSTTLTYSDPYTLNCGDTVYYQVYTYRYSTDQPNGNNYNVARGRAYNETSFGTATIGIPDAPVITGVTKTDSYCSQDNGRITITATAVGGVTLEYSIDNGLTWQTSPVFTNLAPGTYTILVRNAGVLQCQGAYSGNPLEIFDIAGPLLNLVEATDASCGSNNGIITITATGGTPPLQYSINNGVSFSANNTFSWLSPGPYDVVIKDANNCLVVYTNNSVIISMIPSPVAPDDATVDRNNLCADDAGEIMLSATTGSGLLMEWFAGSCGGGTSIGTGTSIVIPSPPVTTTYYVRWTSAVCGNSACDSVTVFVTDPPSAANAGPPQSLCGTYSTQFEGNDPASGTGLWQQISGPGSCFISYDTAYNSDVTVTVYGTYLFTWTISTGASCAENTDTVEIIFGNAITVIASSDSPVCTGDTIFLTSSISGADYLWSGPLSFSDTVQNPFIANATMAHAGIYTVMVSGIPNGCPNTTDTALVVMLQSPDAPLTAAAEPDSVCEGSSGTVRLTANGGSGDLLFWYDGSCEGNVVGTGNNIDIQAPAVTTTYYASWSSNQCGNSACITALVTVIAPPSNADAGGDQTVCGNLSAILDAVDPISGEGVWTVVSGPGTVTIQDTIDNNSPVSVSLYGDYILRWTVSNGSVCAPDSDEVSLKFGTAVQVDAGYNSPVCTGSDIQLSSTIAGARYLWTGPNGFSDTTQNPLIPNAILSNAGIYRILVYDIPGDCPDTRDSVEVFVSQTVAEPVSVMASPDEICSDYTGLITLTAAGGSGDTLEWFTGACGNVRIGTGNSLNISAPVATTTYFARWKSADCGTSACLQYNVTVQPAPSAAAAGGNQSVCMDLVTTLQALQPSSGNGTWSQVSGPGSVYFADIHDPQCPIQVFSMGDYILRWEVSTGAICPASDDSVTIRFSDNITAEAGSNSPVCEGDTIRLTSILVPGATYNWWGPDNFHSDSVQPLIEGAIPAFSGEYWVEISGIPGGCPTTSDTVFVQVSSKPAAPVVNSQNINGSVQELCAGSTVTYSVVNPVPGSVYSWNLSSGGIIYPSGNSGVIDVEWIETGGTYNLTVVEINVAGCPGNPFNLSVELTPASSPAITILADNNPVCAGNTVRFSASVIGGGTSPTYRWIKNGQDVGVNTPEFLLDLPVNNDQVNCLVTSSGLCADPATISSDTIQIVVLDSLMVSCSEEDSLCAGNMNFLSPGQGYSSYLWSDGSTASSITADQPGIYWVMVTDENGCTGSDTVLVEPCAEFRIYAPNAFTPGSDGRNDRFCLVCSNPEAVDEFELLIYNRWGQLIYRSKDIGEGWDGTMSGKPCPADVYSFIVNVNSGPDKSGARQIAGTVALIR